MPEPEGTPEAAELAPRIEAMEQAASRLPAGDPYAVACRRSVMRDRAALTALEKSDA